MSVLRNVLTYMGLGPDEDYEESYLSDADDAEIDLTDDSSPRVRRTAIEPEPARSSDQPPKPPRRQGGRTGRSQPARRSEAGGRWGSDDAEVAPGAIADPHAQRERPDWLTSPTETPEPDTGRARGRDPNSTGRSSPPAPRVAPRGETVADDPVPRDRPSGRRRRGAHDADRPKLGGSDAADSARQPPLRAVPARDGDDAAIDDGLTVHSVDDPGPPAAPDSEPRIRFVTPRDLAPKSFGDAKELADLFKSTVPVVMDLRGVDRELARRLIDFASGICYALDGSMEKVARQVFLLIPVGVEITADERRRLDEGRPTERT